MTQAALITYLPVPIKVKNNYSGSKHNSLTWLTYTVGLGALWYYSPKTFLTASVGILGYIIHHFNQIVHTADKSKHQEIRAWAIHACTVMASVGTVFFFSSFPWFISSFKAARHFYLFRSASHFTVGLIAVEIAYFLASSNDQERILTEKRHWVEMEDYVENYPSGIKSKILSLFLGKIGFFISAIIPQTRIAYFLSRNKLVFNQFSPHEVKFRNLNAYFSDVTRLPSIPNEGGHLTEQWIIAIHQFQDLLIHDQLRLGPHLARIAKASSEDHCNQLPAEVKAILYHERLCNFPKIPTDEEAGHAEWRQLVDEIQILPMENRVVLRSQLFRLISLSSEESVQALPEDLRCLALDHYFKEFTTIIPEPDTKSIIWTIVCRLFENLPPSSQEAFKHNLAFVTKNFKEDQIHNLSIPMKCVILSGLLKELAEIRLTYDEHLAYTSRINLIFQTLPEQEQSHFMNKAYFIGKRSRT
jgi:hypothetical protein